jgi:flagellar FliL protein
MADDSPTDAHAAPSAKVSVPWVPLILVLLFIPIITLLLTELVVVPRLRSSLGETTGAAQGEQQAAQQTAATATEQAATGSTPTIEGNYDVLFENIVANLSGTMGTRFMKVSFHVTSRDAQLPIIIQARRPRVQDAIISTLSSMTIQELEAAGGRNSLRVALIAAVNQAIGMDIVEELFFTEFIIQ